ncbi:MAG: UDP-N-acetylmuramate--alanine ligase [Bacteroidales bacterium]|jgi:UDP-N-acetylmuramate--alanine ligase|nr:UDP-N-acetylmuramate--alanine ligase [Bacteroidales bacterium]MDN5328971.1 UDP-N-acetylmuramate--alanine ligase [Bacteroidales bacterium]
MKLEELHSVYFLGIGGIGMSALARFLHSRGIKVCGYDRTPTRLTSELMEEGISIHFDENPQAIPADTQLVIYTPAIPREHKEWNAIYQRDIPLMKRAEILGLISSSLSSAAVAGTHGKTSTSTMLAHILFGSSMGCLAFLGGISKNFNTNYLNASPAQWMVTEADEYDRSFLHLNLRLAAITAIDADHLDIYQNWDNLLAAFRQFASKIHPEGALVVRRGLKHLVQKHSSVPIFTYAGEDTTADFFALNIRPVDMYYQYDILTPKGLISGIEMHVPARINIENSVAAAAMAQLAGATVDEIRRGLSEFRGIRRRFDVIYNSGDYVYIDDYAHHPEEIKALALSLRDLFPERKLTAIFQPHLYSRTRDLAEGFADSLKLFDEVYLLEIYPAREKPIRGITSKIIARRMNPVPPIITHQAAFNLIVSRRQGVIVTVGAGDIDKLAQLAESHFNTEKV